MPPHMETTDERKETTPPPTRARRKLRSVFLFLFALNLGFGAAVYFMTPIEILQDLARADSFMRFVEIGNDDVDDGDTSGYAAAYDLLAPKFRENTPFPDFLHFFDEQVRRFGFIQSWHRHKREYGSFTARDLWFEVEYGGMGVDSTVVIYELTMSEEDDSFGVSGYRLISATKKSD